MLDESSIRKIESRAAMVAVLLAATLLGAKFTAYFLTASTAVFSDALDSIVNLLASLFALYAISLAHTPADREHPWGHGKVEFLSAGFEGGMILMAACLIIVQAIVSLVRGEHADTPMLGILLLAGAMAANGGVGLYLVRTGRKHGSVTLEADGKHLLSDAVTSVIALASLAVVRWSHWRYADPIAAILVAVYISRIGTLLLRRSLAGLMDEQDLEDQKMFHQILGSHAGPTGKQPRICSYHKLRHRHSGRYHWVDFHMVVPAWWDVELSHRVAGLIELEIESSLGQADATAHVEPCKAPDCPVCVGQKPPREPNANEIPGSNQAGVVGKPMQSG